MTLDYAEVDWGRLLRVVASHFDVLARERGIAYTVDAPGRMLGVCDADKVQRILLNLLSNAFKFTPAGGAVRCAMRVEDGGAERVVLEVADSGPGIPPEHREAIFERFRQLEGGSGPRFGGTGLGLAIARDFVGLHGGAISVARRPRVARSSRSACRCERLGGAVAAAGRLSTEAVDQALQELRSPVERPEQAPTERTADRPTVLIVEDNREMLQFIRESLGERYRFVSARDGREGLARALDSAPDVIVSDIMMPVMSGDALLREIRARRELDSIPVMLLTAKTDEDLRVELLQRGAQDYIMKPFLPGELRARVKGLLDTKRARDVLVRESAGQSRDLESSRSRSRRAGASSRWRSSNFVSRRNGSGFSPTPPPCWRSRSTRVRRWRASRGSRSRPSPTGVSSTCSTKSATSAASRSRITILRDASLAAN